MTFPNFYPKSVMSPLSCSIAFLLVFYHLYIYVLQKDPLRIQEQDEYIFKKQIN